MMKRQLFQVCLAVLCVVQMIPAGWAQTATPYTIDQATRTITVSPTGDATTVINSALNKLVTRSDKNLHWTLKFQGGRYNITKPLFADYLSNVSLVSDRKSPAILVKAPNFNGEYLFYSRFANNVSISGFQFYGKTTFDKNNDPVWEDQGVYFGSGHYLTVELNRFHNFGNGALRITTSEADKVLGINSSDVVVQNNYFANIYQVTTTSNDLVHGATANYLFYNNNFVDLRGSVKFASRTAGARNLRILNNTIANSALDGFEISSYSDVEVSGNRMENIARFAMNCYTNDRAAKGFNWGDNFIVKNNIIRNAGRGIRFSPNAYEDGFKPMPQKVEITNNMLENIGTEAPAISVVNGGINSLSINRSKLQKILSKQYFSISPQSSNVSVILNTVEGASYNKF